MRQLTSLRLVAALALLFSLVCLASTVRAGTTGSLSGTVIDTSTGQPLAGARVSVASPSQTSAVTTDAAGKFSFLSLAPDTYTLSVEKTGYDGSSSSGISIFADQAQQINVRTAKTLRTIGTTRSRSNSELVRPGTVTDVYSVNAATQQRVTGLGGGGSLDQAYSALATVPGVFVPSANNGWSQAAGVVIRGGTHTQVGYEFDGVPVNVGYSFFPGSNLSTLGQQELQAYTGSAPANAQSQGLSGFINQVIKTGTYPGSVDADIALGSPFYHKFSFEASGATANRNFTYYVGFLGANQAFKIVDNFDGTGFTYPYGTQYDVTACPKNATNLNFASCYPATTPGGLGVGPGGFKYVPPSYNNPAYQQDRENVVNLHFAIPHGKGGVKDDVQLLYDTGGLTTYYNTAQTDLPPGVVTSPLTYATSHVYTGALGQPLPSNYASLVKQYNFPSQLNGTLASGLIPANLRDSQQANQGSRNFSTSITSARAATPAFSPTRCTRIVSTIVPTVRHSSAASRRTMPSGRTRAAMPASSPGSYHPTTCCRQRSRTRTLPPSETTVRPMRRRLTRLLPLPIPIVACATPSRVARRRRHHAKPVISKPRLSPTKTP